MTRGRAQVAARSHPFVIGTRRDLLAASFADDDRARGDRVVVHRRDPGVVEIAELLTTPCLLTHEQTRDR